ACYVSLQLLTSPAIAQYDRSNIKGEKQDPCIEFQVALSQLAQLQLDFGLGSDDLDNDGLPEDLAFDLFIFTACDGPLDNRYNATINTSQINRERLRAETRYDAFSRYEDAVALLFAVSAPTERTLLDLFDDNGVGLTAD